MVQEKNPIVDVAHAAGSASRAGGRAFFFFAIVEVILGGSEAELRCFQFSFFSLQARGGGGDPRKVIGWALSSARLPRGAKSRTEPRIGDRAPIAVPPAIRRADKDLRPFSAGWIIGAPARTGMAVLI